MPALLNIAGLLGVVLYIGSYAALQFGLVRGNGFTYATANLLAAALVLVSLVGAFNLSSAIIQTVWIVISLTGILRMVILERTTRLTPEEQAFIASKFPGMARPAARRFLDAGGWFEAAAGTDLATEGQSLGALIYLAQGEADVSLRGRRIGACGPGNFIGEMTCFSGGEATATIGLLTPARYFMIRSEALQKLCQRDAELRHAIEHAVAGDTRTKLVAANAQLHDTAMPGS
ncbi:MAG: cyclic nucleotide-binding domain-containing protein [Limimaricola sp.]|uniref:CBU_0592 family membrane protein n=1 Tax=Limimaricola sp. TaxID=2211665 RepID=UPI001DA36B71|nr:cyclic nucleotide-binding domain-containing protein [Limimaricola sp.]MBI1416211.1 cyclic nucleotide-binding domain-containing protein [Limimaricola sp.]